VQKFSSTEESQQYKKKLQPVPNVPVPVRCTVFYMPSASLITWQLQRLCLNLLIVFRYIEVFESRQSVMDKVIKAGATNERGFNENRRGNGRPRIDISPPRGRGGHRLLLEPSPPRRILGGGGGLRRDSFRDRSHDRGETR
jgi:hypothetical protein